MRAVRTTHLLSFVALLAVTACSSGSSSKSGAPTIDSLTLPTQFSVSGTTYSVQGPLTFHDDGAQVTSMHERIPTYQLDSTVALNPAQAQGTVTVELGFKAQQTIPSGTKVEIDVSLIDSTGAESAVQAQTVTVP
jgi:hypothetical protein